MLRSDSARFFNRAAKFLLRHELQKGITFTQQPYHRAFVTHNDINLSNILLTRKELPVTDAVQVVDHINHHRAKPFQPAEPEFEVVNPIVLPSFNLASYINKSIVLQQIVNLGVAIQKWDKLSGVNSWVVKLDFNKDVEPVVRFLVDNGVQPDKLGRFLTCNPHILNPSLVNLEELANRTHYLYSKAFTGEMIARIFTRNPFWLLFSCERIDGRLGFFQQLFHLTGNEVRSLAAKEPRLITSKLDRVKVMNFGMKEEMGFDDEDTKALLFMKPKLWLMNKSILVERFTYVHKELNLSHATIKEFPNVLTCREFRLRQRHQFLCHLGRAQYDPKLPNYISPYALISGSDNNFVANVAKSSVAFFNDFCKTL